MQNPTIKDFSKARIEFDQSAEEVAQELGCSRTYVYEVLKYPNKNPDLHRRICEYINSAENKLQPQSH